MPDSFLSLYILSGGLAAVETPVPIPNTEVKHCVADGTPHPTGAPHQRNTEPPGKRLLYHPKQVECGGE